MVVVLRSLPLHSLTDDTRAEAERSVREVYASVATRALGDGLGNIDRSSSQAWQFVVIGALRLHYGLTHTPALHQELLFGDELLSGMLKCVSSTCVMPEVVVEMVRSTGSKRAQHSHLACSFYLTTWRHTFHTKI